VTLGASAQIMKEPDLVREMEKIAGCISGVKKVNVMSPHQVERKDRSAKWNWNNLLPNSITAARQARY